MLDFNELPHPRDSGLGPDELDRLSESLAEKAAQWVPRFFPRGKKNGVGWRLADISGNPPRHEGSCVIHLSGPEAGCWFDHSTGKGGKPLSTLQCATGLAGLDLIDRAREIVGQSTPKRPWQNGHATPAATSDKRRREAQAGAAWENSSPVLAGTPAQAYFAARGLECPNSESLRYAASLANEKLKGKALPALVARFSDPLTGEPTGGVHRIYLKGDGSWHIGHYHPGCAKLSLGPSSGIVRLREARSSHLVVGEGIESTLAGCACLGIEPEAEVWAAVSTGNLKRLASSLSLPEAGALKNRVTILTILADKGKDGENSATQLANAGRALGWQVDYQEPRGPDDFADDLQNGLWATEAAAGDVQSVIVDRQPAAPLSAPYPGSAPELTIDTPSGQIAEAIRRLVIAESNGTLDAIEFDRNLKAIRAATNLSSVVAAKLVKQARQEIKILPAKGGFPAWTESIVRTSLGDPIPAALNALIPLRQAPEFQGAIAFDQFRHRPCVVRPLPWDPTNGHSRAYPRPMTDADEAHILVWLQQAGLLSARMEHIKQALSIILDENQFNPLTEYLDSLQWDQAPRLRSALPYYFGVDPIVNYTEYVFAYWAISAVARAYQPGCIAKYCMILEGDQDLGKSTALSILGGEFFSDDMEAMGSKDSKQQVQNAWIMELAELDSARRSDVSTIKAFISRRVDIFRPPYGHHPIEAPRVCVFSGTVNPAEEYLQDETGAVRFWPVKCTAIDLGSLRRDRDQLWAEAVARFQGGERWWMEQDDEEAIEATRGQQALRANTSVWQDHIDAWLRGNPGISSVTIPEVFRSVFEILPRDQDKRGEMAIGAALRRLGWEKAATGRPRPYVRRQ